MEDITPQGCVVKYKFEDPVFLLCPHDRKHGPTIHRRYTVKVRDLPLGIHQSTLEVEVLEVLDFLTPVKLDNLDAIVVDEKFLGRRLKFITVVTDKGGDLLYIGRGKGEDALKGFFDIMTEKQKRHIKVVGADRSNAYTKAVREHLPGADICYDRFHIIKNANDALTKVRRSEFKRNDGGIPRYSRAPSACCCATRRSWRTKGSNGSGNCCPSTRTSTRRTSSRRACATSTPSTARMRRASTSTTGSRRLWKAG